MAEQSATGPRQPLTGASPAYRPSSWAIVHLVNPFTRLAVGRLGLDDHNGTRLLEVRGRVSGRWHATPIRLLELDGLRYLVAPQGETDWVKNLRAQGVGRLRLGRRVEEFRAVELTGPQKVPVLRAYFKRWWSLVARMTPVTAPDAPEEEIARAAPLHPAFLLA